VNLFDARSTLISRNHRERMAGGSEHQDYVGNDLVLRGVSLKDRRFSIAEIVQNLVDGLERERIRKSATCTALLDENYDDQNRDHETHP
jgi:hypothetical protein